MVLIYTEDITVRIQYIFEFIFREILQADLEFISDKEKFIQYKGPKISYAENQLSDELFFYRSELLLETKLIHYNFEPITQEFYGKSYIGYFASEGKGVFQFDVFATCFLLVSRYEEHLRRERDDYHRFHASKSLGLMHHFLSRPIVDEMAFLIKKLIQERYPQFQPNERKFSYTSTIDVDIAYEFLEKGFYRSMGGLLIDLMTFEFKRVSERLKVLISRKGDAYDTYDYIKQVNLEYGIDNIFFFLLGDHSEFDKNIDFKNENFRTLIRSVYADNEVGIHFSYGSHSKPNGYDVERKRLEQITRSKVLRNRFHYLKFVLPDTYIDILHSKIQADYSMGYSSAFGFRAGTCTPFYYFNVTKNEPTTLKVFPFAYMDVTLKHYKKYTRQKAKEKIKILMENTAAVNGSFMSVWHNNSFAEKDNWKGWREVYEYTHQLANEFKNK